MELVEVVVTMEQMAHITLVQAEPVDRESS
jgi:hypothetical protein